MMNNVDNLDYSIETTQKNNKLQIEYKGKIFKENPALITKNTSKVKVTETSEGFLVELDIIKGQNLNFSINNINNEEVKANRKNRKTMQELENITALSVVEKVSVWKKFVHYLRKIAKMESYKETQKEK